MVPYKEMRIKSGFIVIKMLTSAKQKGWQGEIVVYLDLIKEAILKAEKISEEDCESNLDKPINIFALVTCLSIIRNLLGDNDEAKKHELIIENCDYALKYFFES